MRMKMTDELARLVDKGMEMRIEEKLLMLLETLGVDGLNAFYAYLALEYVSLWLLVGLCAWGVRAFWQHMKKGL